MRRAEKFLLRLRSLFRKDAIDVELDAELRFHLEQQIEENLASGMAPEEARYAARRSLGGIAQIKEECRDMRRVNVIMSIFQDLHYAARLFRRSPSLPPPRLPLSLLASERPARFYGSGCDPLEAVAGEGSSEPGPADRHARERPLVSSYTRGIR